MKHTIPFAATLLTILAPVASAADLASNLENPTGGVEVAIGTTRLTAAFLTDGSSHVLNSVQLLIAATGGAGAQVTIHADGGLEPGTMLAAFNSPSTLPATLGIAEFKITGLTLNPSTKYWIVLQGVSGSIDWAWTTTSAGTGVGYSKEWGLSNDAGAFWWTQDRYPLKMAVQVDNVCAADCDASGQLTIDDFICFQTLFALGDPAADCDGSGALTIDDFICFQTLFAIGC